MFLDFYLSSFLDFHHLDVFGLLSIILFGLSSPGCFWTFIYHPFWTILTPVRRAIESEVNFKITISIRRSYSVEMDPSNPFLGPIKLWTFDFACNCNGWFDWGYVSYLDKLRLHH